MEEWKALKFCHNSTLEEKKERRDLLRRLIDERKLSSTNAELILSILEKAIKAEEEAKYLDSLFKD